MEDVVAWTSMGNSLVAVTADEGIPIEFTAIGQIYHSGRFSTLPDAWDDTTSLSIRTAKASFSLGPPASPVLSTLYSRSLSFLNTVASSLADGVTRPSKRFRIPVIHDFFEPAATTISKLSPHVIEWLSSSDENRSTWGINAWPSADDAQSAQLRAMATTHQSLPLPIFSMQPSGKGDNDVRSRNWRLLKPAEYDRSIAGSLVLAAFVMVVSESRSTWHIRPTSMRVLLSGN